MRKLVFICSIFTVYRM